MILIILILPIPQYSSGREIIRSQSELSRGLLKSMAAQYYSGFWNSFKISAAPETTPETERSNYFMFVGRMCTTLDPSLQGSNCPAGMISCDMLSVLCYLWIYSKLSVALSLNKNATHIMLGQYCLNG